MMTRCLQKFNCDEHFDYSLWIPGDAFRPLTPTPSVSSVSSAESDRDEPKEEEVVVDPSQAYAEMVDQSSVQKKFKEFAGGSDKLPASKAGDLARALGLAPSKSDEERLAKEAGSDVSFAQLEKWLVTCTHPEDDVEWLAKFFQQYDKANAGTVTKVQLVNILTNLGDSMSIAEVNKLLTEMGATDPTDYRAFIAKQVEVDYAFEKLLSQLGQIKTEKNR